MCRHHTQYTYYLKTKQKKINKHLILVITKFNIYIMENKRELETSMKLMLFIKKNEEKKS